MRMLLGFTALAEAGLGAVLLVYPPIVVRLLLGTEVSGAGIIVTRVAGIALIGLGVACWPGSSAHQALYGMLAYSTLVMLYLIVVGLGGAAGILLWPAVAVHAALIVLLLREAVKVRNRTAT